MVSESLLDIYADSKIKPSYRSDHNPIQLQLYMSKTKKGKGVWKINNSLLLDEALTMIINKEIELTVSIYACTPYHPDFVKKYTTENIDLMIDIDLFWEVMQAQIREHIMTYATMKKRQQNIREKELITEIDLLSKEIHDKVNDKERMNDFENKQQELEALRAYKLKGALIRARWQQLTMGEKPNKYFLNLENRNFVPKHIREVKKGNISIKDPKNILEEMGDFYENLYKARDTQDINNTNYSTIANNFPQLNGEEILEMEKEISEDELKNIVYKSKNNKSPGPDDFSNEFYKDNWTQIKILLLKLMKFYRLRGELNKAQTNGIITCILKGGKFAMT